MSQPIVMIVNQVSLVSIATKALWFVGVPISLFTVIEKSLFALSDDYVSYGELFRVLAIACVSLTWIHIAFLWDDEGTVERIENKPISSLFSEGLSIDEHQLNAVEARMHELRHHHAIRQLHTLPFPYISQIYHLLNLKHLESVHSFSLNNLRITQVSGTQLTTVGGSIKFDTVLSSPANILNIWRQRQVEVELKLLSPYTVELNIPVYGSKRMIVIFNVIPIESHKHHFLIDIYSDLGWPKSLMSAILHIASLLTLYEDLPYLKKLSTKNLNCLRRYAKSSSRETMWLFQRFVELYAINTQPVQSGNLC